MDNIIIKANEGKVFRRIADGQIYGKEIILGYSYYINGIKLDTPHLDELSDFEQIDELEDRGELAETIEEGGNI